MSAASLESAPARSGFAAWALSALQRPLGWLLGAALCMTPVTAVLAQGWLMGRMRRVAVQAAQRRAGAAPSWAAPVAPAGFLQGLKRIVIDGLGGALSLFLGLAPFTALLLLSWWGGWENSFGKGYEQSWVGPSLGLLGVAIGLPLLARAPMALAHQAVEGRWTAFFERRKVGAMMTHAGWEHVALAACFVLAALPLFAAKGLPVFIEQIRPGFESLSEEEARAFARNWRFLAALYLFAALWVLRGWSARLYAKARLRAEAGGETRAGFGAVLRRLLVWGVWFGLIAQIFVGQFLNIDWAEWLNPPLVALPVVPSLGG